MFQEKKRQQRNSVLSFLITLLILLLLVLSVWLTEQVVHKYKAAGADAEVDVEDVWLFAEECENPYTSLVRRTVLLESA